MNGTNRGYIAYARSATSDGVNAGIERQIQAIRQLGEQLGMTCVDEVRVAGVNGITPVMREDLQNLLIRKQEKNDFDVLIMEDFSRLTRAGLDEGYQIEAEFEKYGVRIVYVAHAQHGDIRRDLRRLLKRIRSS